MKPKLMLWDNIRSLVWNKARIAVRVVWAGTGLLVAFFTIKKLTTGVGLFATLINFFGSSLTIKDHLPHPASNAPGQVQVVPPSQSIQATDAIQATDGAATNQLSEHSPASGTSRNKETTICDVDDPPIDCLWRE